MSSSLKELIAQKRRDTLQQGVVMEKVVFCTEKQPENLKRDERSGDELLKAGEVAKAIEAYTRAAGAINITSTNRGSHAVKSRCTVLLSRARAHTMMGVGNIEWAIKDARSVLKMMRSASLDADSTDACPCSCYFDSLMAAGAYTSIGRSLMAQKRPHQALEIFDRAMRLMGCTCDKTEQQEKNEQEQKDVASWKLKAQQQAHILDLSTPMASSLQLWFPPTFDHATVQQQQQQQEQEQEQALESEQKSYPTTSCGRKSTLYQRHDPALHSASANSFQSFKNSSSSGTTQKVQNPPCYPYGDNLHPAEAWDIMKPTQAFGPDDRDIRTVTPQMLLSPPADDLTPPTAKRSVRFVCISDTHSTHRQLTDRGQLPPGDVLVHTGDFTQSGSLKEVQDFNAWLGSDALAGYKHKIVIAGNHEVTFDEKHYARRWERFHRKQQDSRSIRAALTNCTYLEDAEATIDIREFIDDDSDGTDGAGCNMIRIFGSPYQPKFFDWGFNLVRGEACRNKWELVPPDTHILLTHGPPIGFGDSGHDMPHAGCVDLLQCVQQRVRPLFHIYGHIHSGYGALRDPHTIYLNCASCDEGYQPNNAPMTFDVTRNMLQQFEQRFMAWPQSQPAIASGVKLVVRPGMDGTSVFSSHSSSFLSSFDQEQVDSIV